MGPTYAELGYTPAATSGSLLGDASLQDLANANADAAANEAAQTAEYNTAAIPSGASGINALSQAAAAKALLGGGSGGSTGTGSQSGTSSTSSQSSTPSISYSPGTSKVGTLGYSGAATAPTLSSYSAGNQGLPAISNTNLSTLQLDPSESTLAKLPNEYALYERGLAAGGGITTLGGYSDGGQLLKGPGDGMSDDIPAKIGHNQPARLADGEFVIPADVVSHFGNGSTDAGAKVLYQMMDKIRQARTGNKKQGKQIDPYKFLPKG
jgi:hypothetical protein